MVQQLRPPFVQTPRPRRILVIGGGVGGLAALRALVEQGGVGQSADGAHIDGSPPPFDDVQLIERRDDVGGVWYLDAETVALEKSMVNGTADGQWPVVTGAGKPVWPSPAYPALRGNVLPRFLSLAGTEPFPPFSRDRGQDDAASSQVPDPYPTLVETHNYLRRIAQPLRSHIRCGVECLGVWELPDPHDAGKNRWAVRTRDWRQEGIEVTEYWDAVVMSVGWTDRPIYPHITGMSEARKAGFVEHCKWYRGPEKYGRDDRVVVVGNGNSGNDVCAQLAARRTYGKHEPIIRICRHKARNYFVSLPDRMIRDAPAIDRIIVRRVDDGMDATDTIDLHLIDGAVVQNVDRIIVAAGYEMAQFPFVRILDRDVSVSEAQELSVISEAQSSDWTPESSSSSSSGSGALPSSVWRAVSDPPHCTKFDDAYIHPPRVSGLFMHFLHERASTLAFVNLSVSSVPFWTSDAQSHCVRAAWDGSMSLPATIEGRGTYERTRLAFLRSLFAQREENLRKEEDAWRARMQDLSSAGEGGTSLYEAPKRIALPPYHVLATMVDDYLPLLRNMAVEAKPEWEARLPLFEEVQQLHRDMYDVRYATLKAKRDAAVRSASASTTRATIDGGRKDAAGLEREQEQRAHPVAV